MRSVVLASGATMPVFGLGTWYMGDSSARREAEADAIRYGLDLGITLIDTAEMYGEGGAEEVVGDAISGRREQLFIVSKVYPHNASRQGVIDACHRSLRRLRTDYIDLYLLHWPGSEPLEETFAGFHALQDEGEIRDFGVSNFDVDDLRDVPRTEQTLLGTNQVFYNLAHREVEWTVMPWCREHHVPIMAYSPLDQAGALLDAPVLRDVARKYGATVPQVALAWLLQQEQVVVIPKSSQRSRIKENLGALDIALSAQDLTDLNQAFPAPTRAVRLGMR